MDKKKSNKSLSVLQEANLELSLDHSLGQLGQFRKHICRRIYLEHIAFTGKIISELSRVVLRLESSACADNPFLELHMELVMHGCLETFSFENFHRRFLDQLKTCLIQVSTNMCGADMGNFEANIWDMATCDQFAPFGYDQNAISSHECTNHPYG
ncbi:hypothetical protein PoB_003611700 [Plakobranchus ocellatus]|uniref:Uncharacterized protein n=1 Tax=Plakobranchus ocellatus TaxID=259542 RepID=A0AAV4ARN4_9GAST|nr:hypothetical protein PoB_003611700 [Plakobranchus ocellatus]